LRDVKERINEFIESIPLTDYMTMLAVKGGKYSGVGKGHRYEFRFMLLARWAKAEH